MAYFVGVVHGHSNTRSLEIVYIHHGGCRTVYRGIHHLQFTGPRCNKVSCTILLDSGPSTRVLIASLNSLLGHQRRVVQ